MPISGVNPYPVRLPAIRESAEISLFTPVDNLVDEVRQAGEPLWHRTLRRFGRLAAPTLLQPASALKGARRKSTIAAKAAPQKRARPQAQNFFHRDDNIVANM